MLDRLTGGAHNRSPEERTCLRCAGLLALVASAIRWAALLCVVLGCSAAAPPQPGTLKWKFNTQSRGVYSSPAIGPDGTVYVGGGYGTVHALDPATGEQWWSVMFGNGSVVSAPAIGRDRTVYIGVVIPMYDMFGLDGITGVCKWRRDLGGHIESSPAISYDGHIYITAYGGKDFFALDGQTGADLIQPVDLSGGRSSPAIDHNETVYVRSSSTLKAVNRSNGEVIWSTVLEGATNEGLFSSPTIGLSGTIYIGSRHGLFALDNRSGHVIWQFQTLGTARSSAAIDEHGKIYIGDDRGVMYAVTPTGQEVWRFSAKKGDGDDSQILCSPAVTADGTVVFMARTGKVYALHTNDGSAAWEYDTHSGGPGVEQHSSPSIANDGTVYIGGFDGYIYAIHGTGPLAQSIWPKFRQGPRNTGRPNSVTPVIQPPGPMSAKEEMPWALTLAANDADTPSSGLSYRLLEAPAGSALNAASGRLTWTPTELQGPGTYDFAVEVADDGWPIRRSTNTFQLTVLEVNKPPTYTKGSDQVVLEDRGEQIVRRWGCDISAGPAGDAGRTVTFLVSVDNPSLFAAGPDIDPEGNLHYTPASNMNGEATISVRLQDDGGTANGGRDTSAVQTFSITVLPVNDPPSFVKGSDQAVLGGAGPQTVWGWASGMSAGPADEAGQTLNFRVTVDRPELFLAGPTIDPAGNLMYTPAVHTNGSACVTVWVQDNGGTENGGEDASPSQMFTILIRRPIPPRPTVEVSLASDGDHFSVRVMTEPGFTYRLECQDEVSTDKWEQVAEAVGNGTTLTLTDPDPLQARRFYRIAVD